MSNPEKTCTLSESRDGPARADRAVTERITSRNAEIGKGMLVRRALPSRTRRMVGAWCFLDHAGPADYGPGEGLSVGPHPHIGLQTFTWMIEGEILHRDSLGHEQIIRPGQVNLMTAGHGISHSEEAVSDRPGRIHAAQLWIALPGHERDRAPAFQHCPELPRIEQGGFVISVLAGNAFGQTAPPTVFSPLVCLDLTSGSPAHTKIPLQHDFEHAALCLDGTVSVAGERIEPGTLLYLGLGRNTLAVSTSQNARLLLVGGAPFAENILQWWNFVGRTREDMEQATADWHAGRRFGEVRGTRLKPLTAPDLAGLRLQR